PPRSPRLRGAPPSSFLLRTQRQPSALSRQMPVVDLVLLQQELLRPALQPERARQARAQHVSEPVPFAAEAETSQAVAEGERQASPDSDLRCGHAALLVTAGAQHGADARLEQRQLVGAELLAPLPDQARIGPLVARVARVVEHAGLEVRAQ